MAEQSCKEYIKESELPVRSHKGKAIRKLNFIVCLTGMPGSGKSTVAEFMREHGFSLVTMGDIVREEAKRSQIELTDSNLGRLMMKMRDKDGPGAIAQLIRKEIERIETKYSMNNFVVDGVRSLSEVEILRAVGSVKLLSIHASARVRFEHLKKRTRDDAPLTSDDFEARDKRELSVGISEAIALSDEVLSNNSLTIGELKQKSMGLVQQWVKEHNNMYFPHTGEKS